MLTDILVAFVSFLLLLLAALGGLLFVPRVRCSPLRAVPEEAVHVAVLCFGSVTGLLLRCGGVSVGVASLRRFADFALSPVRGFSDLDALLVGRVEAVVLGVWVLALLLAMAVVFDSARHVMSAVGSVTRP